MAPTPRYPRAASLTRAAASPHTLEAKIKTRYRQQLRKAENAKYTKTVLESSIKCLSSTSQLSPSDTLWNALAYSDALAAPVQTAVSATEYAGVFQSASLRCIIVVEWSDASYGTYRIEDTFNCAEQCVGMCKIHQTTLRKLHRALEKMPQELFNPPKRGTARFRAIQRLRRCVNVVGGTTNAPPWVKVILILVDYSPYTYYNFRDSLFRTKHI